jgi:hypothetical protein
MFPITPTLFMQYVLPTVVLFSLVYMGQRKGTPSFNGISILGSTQFFLFGDGPIKMAHCKKHVGLGRHSPIKDE